MPSQSASEIRRQQASLRPRSPNATPPGIEISTRGRIPTDIQERYIIVVGGRSSLHVPALATKAIASPSRTPAPGFLYSGFMRQRSEWGC